MGQFKFTDKLERKKIILSQDQLDEIIGLTKNKICQARGGGGMCISKNMGCQSIM